MKLKVNIWMKNIFAFVGWLTLTSAVGLGGYLKGIEKVAEAQTKGYFEAVSEMHHICRHSIEFSFPEDTSSMYVCLPIGRSPRDAL